MERPRSTFNVAVPRTFATDARNALAHLNKIQAKAVVRAVTVTEYVLIKGLPGTGKTQTLTSIIQMLIMLNKTVLVTSHTHSAVDNVLRRLIPEKIKFLRIGEPSKVAEVIRPFCATTLTRNCRSPDEIRSVYESYVSVHSVFEIISMTWLDLLF